MFTYRLNRPGKRQGFGPHWSFRGPSKPYSPIGRTLRSWMVKAVTEETSPFRHRGLG